MKRVNDARAKELILAGRQMMQNLGPLFVGDMGEVCKTKAERALYFSGMLAALGGVVSLENGFDVAKAMFLQVALGIAGAEDRINEEEAAANSVKH